MSEFKMAGIRYLQTIIRRSASNECNAEVRVRFAPSPTGNLHLGGLRTALYNYLFARSQSGKFILRIEDTDRTRLVPGAGEALVDMLEWAGIEIDEGPHVGGDYGPYRQSERLHIYHEHIEVLLENGSAYRCYCSEHRLEILRRDAVRRRETPRYDNRCRHLSREESDAKMNSGESYVVRLKLKPYEAPFEDLVYGPIECDVSQIEGDPILLKTDGFPTYHFANVVDDHLMRVTHVLRGVEWQNSTTKHLLLYEGFDWPAPKFAHLPLLLNANGTKLSKRQNDIHVEYFKKKGVHPESIINLLTIAGGAFDLQSTEGLRLHELIDHFDINKVNRNSSRIATNRLSALDRLFYARRLGEDLQSRVAEVRQRLHEAADYSDDYIGRILEWSKTRISNTDQLFDDDLQFLWYRNKTHVDSLIVPHLTVDLLSTSIQTIESIANVHDKKEVVSLLKQEAKLLDMNFKDYMQILRILLCGKKIGPSVAEIIDILGTQECVKRLILAREAIIKNNDGVMQNK